MIHIRPRITCPVCSSVIALQKNGVMYRHIAERGARCRGSNIDPARFAPVLESFRGSEMSKTHVEEPERLRMELEDARKCADLWKVDCDKATAALVQKSKRIEQLEAAIATQIETGWYHKDLKAVLPAGDTDSVQTRQSSK